MCSILMQTPPDEADLETVEKTGRKLSVPEIKMRTKNEIENNSV